MLFSPGTLENYPSTLITSFYLTDTNKNHLNILVKEFPSITILEVDLIIKQFKIILTQLTAAINYLLYFSLLAGFTVLFATVYSTLDHRIYESTLMRTFGASQRLLTTSHLIEFSLIGLLSGLIAVFMSELIIYTLYTLVLHLDYHISNLLWWFVPLLSSLCITAAGTFAVRDVVNKSPMQVLREL